MRRIFEKLFSSLLPPSRKQPDLFEDDIRGETSKSKEKKFPASMPREMYWSNDVGGTDYCPRCHSKLESEYHSYVMAVKVGEETEPFMIGNKDGYFCSTCPLVVLDHEAVAKITCVTLDATPPFDIAVLGIVDMDAFPEGKEGIPLGDDENPIPLVRFLNQRGGNRNVGGRRSTRKKKRVKPCKGKRS